MKTLTKHMMLSVSVLFLIPIRTTQACGFYVYPGEYRFWLLQPDITNEPDLTPFYFAASYLYHGDQYAGKEPYIQQNINEWYEEVNGNASKKDIDSLLNATPPDLFFEKQERLAKVNSFMRYILQQNQNELYQYMALSKKVENIAFKPDPWDEESTPKPSITDVINELKILHSTAKSNFIQLRSAFQLIRLYYYNAQSRLAEEVYDAWVAPVKTKSWVKTASLYQIAINTKAAKHNYLLSKVFDQGGYNRTTCLVRFTKDDLENSLKLVKDNHERNVLLAMKVFNYPGRSLRLIKQIYSSEPNYKELPFLLLREINKVEDWLLSNKLTSFPVPAVYGEDYWSNDTYLQNSKNNYLSDKAYAKDLYSFLNKMISEGMNKQKVLMHLYAAHIALMLKDYVRSSEHLNQAASENPQQQNLKTQIALNQFLINLENGFNKNVENEFMSIIKTPDKKLGVYDPSIMKNQLILYTSRKLISKGYRAKGLMLLSKTNRAFGELPIRYYKNVYQEIEETANESDYLEMIQTFDIKNKTPFEYFISEKKIHSPLDNYEWYEEDSTTPKWNRNKLLDCLSSWYLKKHRLEDAYSILERLPGSLWRQYPYKDYIGGNPFYLNVYKAHPVSKEDRRSLNKMQVVKEMLHLEQLALKEKSKAAECYYQLANAWYNMTWYGKNWLMVKQWWSNNEPDTYGSNVIKTTFNDDYYGCRQAKMYYDKAFKSSKDKKLAALCFFMSQKCDENYRYYMQLVNRIKDAKYDFKPNNELAKKNGIDTEYYRQVIEECETYQSFIRKYNKVY